MSRIYEVYRDTECPRCGNTERNRDSGPYDYMPEYDDALGGPPDPRVHLIWCGDCGKPFDVAPEEVARAAQEPYLHYYDDACPHPDCHPGDHPAVTPHSMGEKRGRYLADYECTRGHQWVTWWGGRKLDSVWPIERELVNADDIAARFDAMTRNWGIA